MDPISLPDRSGISTVGDMARVIVEDERAIRLKNADLEALRQWAEASGTE